MNVQNVEQENWVVWKPYEGLPTKCSLDVVNNSLDQLHILVSKYKEASPFKISVIFNRPFFMYRVSDETSTIGLLYDVTAKYGNEFIHSSSFFIIENSSYRNWLVAQAGGLLGAKNIHHYCIYTVNYVVDVLALQAPLVTIVQDEHYS